MGKQGKYVLNVIVILMTTNFFRMIIFTKYSITPDFANIYHIRLNKLRCFALNLNLKQLNHNNYSSLELFLFKFRFLRVITQN